MLIVCPACASEYQIDLDRVGAEGRSVRCAACRETWFISPDEVAAAMEAEMTAAMLAASETGPDAAESRASAQADLDAWEAALSGEAEPEAEPRPQARPKARPAKPTRRPSVLASPTALVAFALVAGLGLAILARSTVVRMIPQSADLYARIGLPVNLRGIDLADVAAFQVAADGSNPARLVVEGDLVAVARERVAVPPIEVEVRDAEGQPLYRWSVPGPRAALEPGERARFKASLSAPPEKGRRIEVRFSDAAQAEMGVGENR